MEPAGALPGRMLGPFLVAACTASVLGLTVRAREKQAGEASMTTREVCLGVFGHPRGLWETGKTLSDLGVTAVFVSSRELDADTVERVHREGAKVYAELGIFVGKKKAEERPELWPVGRDGRRLAPIDWYLGLCPTNPQLRREKLEAVAEAARRAPIDGVWLDFIRWPCHWEVRQPRLDEACFCPACLADFEERTGIALPEGDTATRAEAILADNLDAWSRWKCDSITRFCAEARKVLQRERPGALLGVFSVPWNEENYDGAIRRVIGQDFAALAEHVDVFSPMAYHKMCGWPVDWIHEHVAYLDRVTGGKAVWPIVQAVDHPEAMSADELGRAVTAGLKSPSDGVMIFTLKELLEKPEKFECTRRAFHSAGSAGR